MARILINALALSEGGGLTYMRNVLRELDRDPRGLEFAVVAPSGRLVSGEAGRLPVLHLRLPRHPYYLNLAVRVAYEEFGLPRRRGFDLLYCAADLAPFTGSLPTVVALRNLNVYDTRFYNTPRLRVLRRLIPPGLRRARRVVFPSQAAADAIRSTLAIPQERVSVVPHGIAFEAFDHVTPVESDVPYLFIPAALERHKSLETAIEALLHVRDPRLEYWVAGRWETDPAYLAELRALAERLGVASRVRFMGPVPYEQILGYHAGAVALVFPSLLETFGHPLLEAMLVETPVVATDIPTFREIAGDAGWYFPARDPRALAAQVDRVIADSVEAKRRSGIGHERALGFSWERSVDALCRVFEAALGSEVGAVRHAAPEAEEGVGRPRGAIS